MIKYLLAALMLTVSTFANDKVDIDGHTPGRFTMDLEAARKYATEKDIPLLLNFTGSDWCGWCKLMEKNVFSKPEWVEYAKGNVVMVWLDFPKDKSLVPAKYVARNGELSSKYGVRGYPTYLIIDAKSDTVIGKLGAGQEKTPVSFKAEVENVASMSGSRVKAFAKSLGDEKGSEYLKMYEKVKQNEAELKTAKEEYENKVNSLKSEIAELKNTMEETRVISGLKKDQVDEYLKARGEYKAAQAALEKFLSTNPAQNQENMKIYQDLGAKIKEAQEKLSKF